MKRLDFILGLPIFCAFMAEILTSRVSQHQDQDPKIKSKVQLNNILVELSNEPTCLKVLMI